MGRRGWMLIVAVQVLALLLLGLGAWWQRQGESFTIERGGSRESPESPAAASPEPTDETLPETPPPLPRPAELHPIAAAARARLLDDFRRDLVADLAEITRPNDTPAWDVAGLTIPERNVAWLIDDGGSTLNRWRAAGGTTDAFRDKITGFLETVTAERAIAIVTFVRAVGTWEDRLQPGTVAVKARAREWVQTSLGSTRKSTEIALTRSGIEGALEIAAELGAEACVIVSDGSFQRTPGLGGGTQVQWDELAAWRAELRDRTGGEPVWYWLAVAPEAADREAFSQLIRSTGGEVADL